MARAAGESLKKREYPIVYWHIRSLSRLSKWTIANAWLRVERSLSFPIL